METEGPLKTKMEELKALSARKTEMELMVCSLKAEIETKVELLEARLVALAENEELEADLVKKEEKISITTLAGPAPIIDNFGNCANYVHMGEGT